MAVYQAWPSQADFVIPAHWPARRAFNFMRGTAEWGMPFDVVCGSERLRVRRAIVFFPDRVTQAIFYADPSVLYCWLHAHPDDDYPYYWGAADEHGEGAGEGYNRNWPLPQKIDDAGYLAALDEALDAIGDFAPRCMIVSAGFDIIAGDPVGGFSVTTQGLGEIGRQIAALRRPTLILQEGGYPRERLGANAVTFLGAFG